MPNIIELTDFNTPELDVYARLNENQLFHRNEPAPGFLLLKVQRSLSVHWMPDTNRSLFYLKKNM